MHAKTIVSRLLGGLLLLTTPVLPFFASPNTVTEANFSLSGIKDPLLFPESNTSLHPSTLATLDQGLLILDLDLANNSQWETLTRQDETQGAKGGTKATNDQLVASRLGLDYFTQSGSNVLALGGEFSLDWDSFSTQETNFKNFTQNEAKTSSTLPISFSLEGTWANKSKDFRSAYRLGYTFENQGAYAEWISNKTTDPGLTYVSSIPNAADFYGNTINATADWGSKFGNLDLTMGVDYTFAYHNRDTQYLAYDKDGDGFNESFTNYATWIATSELFDDASRISQSSIQDRTFAHSVDINALARFDINQSTEFMVSGTYTALDLAFRKQFLRLISTNVPEDISYTQENRGQDFGNYSLAAVLGLKNSTKTTLWRFGVEYTREAKTVLLDGATKEGGYLFTSNNLSNYPELALGQNPSITALSLADIEPALTVENVLKLAMAMDWNMTRTAKLVWGFDVIGSIEETSYRVFNTDTQTVWEETQQTSTVTWTPIPQVALELSTGEKSSLIINLSGVKGDGSFQMLGSTLPTDLNLGRTTENGGIDQKSNGNLVFDLGITMVFKQ